MINELTIIIPALNEAGYLPELLDSITKQTFTGKLQVIVVDGHSTDKTVDVARSFAALIKDLVVLESERGIGHQRNVGAMQAKYSYLLFIDADVILPPQMLEQLSSKVPATGPFVAGVMHTAKSMDLADRAFLIVVHALMYLSWVGGSPATVGDFILTTRENHRKIHGFVEGAILGEDIDYGLRSRKAGAKNRFYFSPQVVASDRRVRELGRIRLLLLWSKGFWHVRKHGPIFPREGFEYPFGHYGSEQPPKEPSSMSSRI